MNIALFAVTFQIFTLKTLHTFLLSVAIVSDATSIFVFRYLPDK